MDNTKATQKMHIEKIQKTHTLKIFFFNKENVESALKNEKFGV